MKCPVCTATDLQMTERQGVEIDYCPKCRGVWLDRGELDKLIERSESVSVRESYRDHDDDDYRRESYDRHTGKRKKSMWGQLFDFD